MALQNRKGIACMSSSSLGILAIIVLVLHQSSHHNALAQSSCESETTALSQVTGDLVYSEADTREDAEVLSLEVTCQELVPVSELTNHIFAALALIRQRYPQMNRLRKSSSYVPNQILIGWTEKAQQQQTGGTFNATAYDSLNTELGFVKVEEGRFGDWVLIESQTSYNIPLLLDRYRSLEGVSYAETNAMIGGKSRDIVVNGELNQYTFQAAWGDCPAGCIYSYKWTYQVNLESCEVSLIDQGCPSVQGQTECLASEDTALLLVNDLLGATSDGTDILDACPPPDSSSPANLLSLWLVVVSLALAMSLICM